MRKLIKRLIPKKFHEKIRSDILVHFRKDYKESYAQSGEDLILDLIFCNVKKGFYVDVGANNPTLQSNTYFFYKKGWSGINIDALPGSMKEFNRVRPRDINLEFAVSDQEQTLKYHMFKPSFYNSFTEEAAILYSDKLIGSIPLSTKKLYWILDNYLASPEINFLTIDVEGLDFLILQSNDWFKYRPKVIVIELFASPSNQYIENEEKIFLKEKGYSFFCSTPTNAFFIENNFLQIRFPDKF